VLCCAPLPKKTLFPLILLSLLSSIVTIKKINFGSRTSLCFYIFYLSKGEKRRKIKLKIFVDKHLLNNSYANETIFAKFILYIPFYFLLLFYGSSIDLQNCQLPFK